MERENFAIDLERKLRGCFESRIFERGRDYFRDGLVRKFSYDGPDEFGWITANAKVRGSATYDVESILTIGIKNSKNLNVLVAISKIHINMRVSVIS